MFTNANANVFVTASASAVGNAPTFATVFATVRPRPHRPHSTAGAAVKLAP
jgi:hypothetical protein